MTGEEVLAAIYCRVSTEEQAQKGASIEGQKDYLRTLAEDLGKRFNKPVTIVREYVDEGRSGTSIDREDLTALLREGKAGVWSLLLVYHNDRLSRNTEDTLRMVRELQEAGVTVHFGNLGVDIESGEGKLMLRINAAVSEYFIDDLKRKTRVGMTRRKKEGYKIGRLSDYFEKIVKIQEDGSKAPLVPENVRVKPEYEELVAEVIRLSKIKGKNKRSYRQIARETGIEPPGWAHKKVKRIIETWEWLTEGRDEKASGGSPGSVHSDRNITYDKGASNG